MNGLDQDIKSVLQTNEHEKLDPYTANLLGSSWPEPHEKIQQTVAYWLGKELHCLLIHSQDFSLGAGIQWAPVSLLHK